MTLFVGVRAKTYAYLKDDDSELKKVKGTEKCIIKRKLMVKNYEDSITQIDHIFQIIHTEY